MNVLETSDFDDAIEPVHVGAEFDGDDAPDFEGDEELADTLAADAEVSVPIRVSDERANVPVSEVTERFLRAILAKVPLDRIEELHLFSPLRQGTVETGIAVVAARVFVPSPAAIESDNADSIEAATEIIDPIVVDSTNEDEMIAIEVAVEDVHTDSNADNVTPAGIDSEIDDNFVLSSDTAEIAALGADENSKDDSPYADEVVVLDEFAGAESSDVGEDIVYVAPEAPRIRHTVYTARYRLVIKGPERGRWEIDVVDEADAPLLTVETVVRGVQRRAGEDTATVRYTAAQIARALHIDPPSSL